MFSLLPDFITRHVLFALVIGGIGGVLFMLFLIEFDHYTGTEEFCTSCHSMELAAEPYRESAHYQPTSGVRADCGHCHVSPGIFAATWDHFIGGGDLIKQIKGAMVGPDYDDPVIHALNLPESAFNARDWFRRNDSESCKRCHVQEAIFGKRADTLDIHTEDAKGKTCVDCHINLVHRAVPERKTFKRDKWNRMVEQEFGLEEGEADRLMAK